MGFNWLVLNGGVAAFFKWLVEATKLKALEGRLLGVWFWRLSDWASMLLARTILRSHAKTNR